ncbi:MAG: PQQ-binding-like beta-propeller repeat protein, partial [Planctomycetota bacterium]
GPRSARRLLGRAAELSVEAGWSSAAREIVRFASRSSVTELETSEGRRATAAWRRRLESAMPPLASTGNPQPGEGLSARLVFAHPNASFAPATDYALLFDGRDLTRLEGNSLEAQWRHTLDDPGPMILDQTPRGILLWLGTNPLDPRAVMLEPSSGRELWSTPPLSRHLGDALRDLVQDGGVREQMPSGAPFDPTETLPLVRNRQLILARRSGGALLFDQSDGTEPIWTAPETLEEVHLAEFHELGIVLAGQHRQLQGNAPGELVPSLVILDPDDGTIRKRIRPLTGAGVKWMCVTPLGSLIYATSGGIEAVDIVTGTKRWTNLAYEITDTQRGWVHGPRVVIEDRDRYLRAISVVDGSISEPFDGPPHGDWDELELQDLQLVADRLYVRYRQRVIRYDDRGAVVGADVVTDQRDYRWLVPIDGGLLLVSRHQTEHARIPNQRGRRTEHVYRIYRLSENCKVISQMELPPVTQAFTEAVAIDGAILLSNQAQTLVIPMRPEPASRQ